MFMHFRSLRNLGRYREIVTILARHGFGSVLEYLQVDRHLSLPAALFRQTVDTPHRPAEHLRMALEELGPTFIKLGQILSTRPDLLPPDYIVELTKLQDAVPSCPWEQVEAELAADLGRPPQEVFVRIDTRPLAAASLAQVYAAELKDGASNAQVVIKVQRPGVQTVIESDLEILEDLAGLAQRTPLGEMYDPVEIVADFAFTLRNELDYVREGRNADRFRANFASESHLYIPRIYWPHSTRRLLVMERISGIKIDDVAALDAAGYDRHRVALHAADIIVKEILKDGFFHADPHPGNLVVMPGEVIGAMDFGMVGRLTLSNRLDLARLYVATIRQDTPAVTEQLIHMSATGRHIDRHTLERDVSRLLDKYASASLKSVRMSDFLQEVLAVAYRHHLRLPADLFLVAKTAAMMEGLGLRLDPDFDPFTVSRPYTEQMARELWSPRAWGPALMSNAESWARLAQEFPRIASSALRGLETGELPMKMNVTAAKDTIDRVDRLVTRLSISILISAFVLGLAFLVPVSSGNTVLQVLMVMGFLAVLILGIWFALSILRGSR